MHRHLPNAITVLRLGLLPWFVHALLQGRRTTALYVYIAIALSDWLDGWLARRFRITTPLGAVLDPIADKLVQLTALFLLARTGELPLWFLGLVLARDLLLLYGVLRIRRRHRRVTIEARIEGKMSTLFVFLTIFATLAGAPEVLRVFLIASSTFCVVASAVRYTAVGRSQYRGETA